MVHNCVHFSSSSSIALAYGGSHSLFTTEGTAHHSNDAADKHLNSLSGLLGEGELPDGSQHEQRTQNEEGSPTLTTFDGHTGRKPEEEAHLSKRQCIAMQTGQAQPCEGAMHDYHGEVPAGSIWEQQGLQGPGIQQQPHIDFPNSALDDEGSTPDEAAGNVEIAQPPPLTTTTANGILM